MRKLRYRDTKELDHSINIYQVPDIHIPNTVLGVIGYMVLTLKKISVQKGKKICIWLSFKQTHRYREHVEGCQIGRGFGGMGKSMKGLRSINVLLQKSHEDVK